MTHQWNYRTITPEEEAQSQALARELGIHPALGKLLVQRGITGVAEARTFFKPQLHDLHDPFLMNDMDKAVDRLNRAMGKKERVLIYGDYDVDGTTSVSLVYKFIQQFYSNVDYYIPDRYDEGYGVSYRGIDYAAETGVKLIITLDCGIKAVEKVEYAKQKGIDVIICDHHMPGDVLPDAVAVIDAKRADSEYPYEHLSGCGIGFKLVQALAQNNGISFHELVPLLDLVAVSIAADLVPITGENRIFAYHGLRQLNSSPGLGLKGIIELCELDKKTLTMSDIIFKIGPRINASGRMLNGKKAVELLLASSAKEARQLSADIDGYNEERRDLDKKMTEEAIAYVEEHIDQQRTNCIILYNEHWHKGVIGIVASRLTEKYYRPAIVLTKSGDLITGSARSGMNFDVYRAIESGKHLLENFGGHTYAAGLSMREENFEAFCQHFEKQTVDAISLDMLQPQVDVDAELVLGEINSRFVYDLNKFAPFGPDNPNPIFVTHNVSDYGTSKQVGNENIHLKLEITDDTSERSVHGIAFKQGQQLSHIKDAGNFSLCYTIEENVYRGRTSVQLYVKDICVKAKE